MNKKLIADFLTNELNNRGLFLVDIDFRNQSVKIEIDSLDSLNIDHCAAINKEIRKKFGEQLDDYNLTVTSPGLDKPFKTKEQYIKNLNKEVEVLQKDGEKYVGVLKEVNDDNFVLDYLETGKTKKEKILKSITIDYKIIKSTKAIIKI